MEILFTKDSHQNNAIQLEEYTCNVWYELIFFFDQMNCSMCVSVFLMYML